MNYRGKKIAITGTTGFLGYRIAQRLSELGSEVIALEGDIRDINTFNIDYTFSYLFHFADPSSQVLFKRQPRQCIDTTINGFLNASRVCQETGTKLIYPSTGLLSQNRFNEYAMCKKICEDIHAGGLDAMGLRIFATYGDGEGHKRDYASVPYLFAEQMVRGKKPLIFGDGTQERDFIFIDDCVEAVVTLAEECNEKIVDIGSGAPISFNKIIKIINNNLNTNIIPEYVGKPENYVSETCAKPDTMNKYYKPKFSFEEGMERVICELQSLQQQ